MKITISKICERTSFILLAIIISGLLNVCMFNFKTVAAAQYLPAPEINSFNNGETCDKELSPEPMENINRPTAPMPECCLAQNRNFNAVVNTDNNKTTPTFTNQVIFSSTNLNFENNSTHNTLGFIYSPPEALALISTIIRE